MKVLCLSSEVAPWASTGEVGESVGALAGALERQGLEVRVAMPLYQTVRGLGGFRTEIGTRVVEGAVEGTGPATDPKMLFVRSDAYFGRPAMYGYEDEAERFIFLTKGALAAAKQVGFRPDVIHVHDWQTGLAPWILREAAKTDPFYARAATVFSIHNLAYQGCFGPWALGLAGLPVSLLTPEALEFYGQVSFLKGGIVGADLVTAPSPNQAREFATEQHGENLHGVIAARGQTIRGVLNGVCAERWDPATDPVLAAPFGAGDLAGRTLCTEALQGLCDLSERPGPIFAVASPLTTQYGLHAVAGAIPEIAAMGGRLVVIGRGDEYHEKLLRHLEGELAGRLRVLPDDDDALLRAVLAGADFLLRPSLREPHGGRVMEAMRYGCVPVVSSVGPLVDILSAAGGPEVGGLLCERPTPEALTEAARRAVALHASGAAFGAMQRRAIAVESSWDARAAEWVGLYERAIALRRPTETG